MCAALALACGGSQRLEVPLCSAPELRPEPTEACREQADFAVYRDELARTLAQELRWQIPSPLSLSVELDSGARVERVCAAPEAASLPWNLRRWLVGSLGPLRAIPAGPVCAANARVELSDALLEATSMTPEAAAVIELASCLGIREHVCIEQNAEVCGVFADGTRHTYPNACNACENTSLKGWFEGRCPIGSR